MSANVHRKTVVLVVDDEQIVQESVKRILEDEEGCLVDTASGHDAAIALLRTRHYDLAFVDLMMPAHNGMKLVQTIHDNYTGTGVIILTGYPSVDSAVEAMKMGALDYMAKPFTPEDLVGVTRRSLQTVSQQLAGITGAFSFEDVEKAIKSSSEIKELLDLICSSVVNVLNLKGASILVRMRDNNKARIASFFGLSDTYINKGAVDCSRSIPATFNSSECVLVEDESFRSNLHYPEEALDEGISSILSAPLKIGQKVIGALRVYSGLPRTFSDDDIVILQFFANQTANAIKNAISLRELKNRCERIRDDIKMKVGETGRSQ
jgi:DNA-binding response OmpR family regulator